MLEILLLIFLCKKVGSIVGPKGYSPGWFKFFAVIAWFGGEIAGAFIGVIIAMMGDPNPQGPPMGIIYVGALVGAAVGVGIVFVIANSLAEKSTH